MYTYTQTEFVISIYFTVQLRKKERKKNHLKTYAKKVMLTTNNWYPEWQESTWRDQ